MFPVRCFSCGKVVGNKYETYKNLLQENHTAEEALNLLSITRYCCRRIFLTHVDVNEMQLNYMLLVMKSQLSITVEQLITTLISAKLSFINGAARVLIIKSRHLW